MPIDPIVAIGASSGGLEALTTICGALKPDMPAAILVVLHSAPDSPGIVGEILDRASPLPAANARDREPLRPGRIYVAPPDRHLLVEPGRLRVSRGPKENRFRPAIDPLFRSVAQVFGPRATGIILTGNLDDGTAGLWTIKQLGGCTVVQDPDDAPYRSMPINAIEHVQPDFIVPLTEIAPLIDRLVRSAAVGRPAERPRSVDVEVQIAKEGEPVKAGVYDLGPPSLFACPACHGVLLQLKEGRRTRYRCHTGHAYSLQSLLAETREAVETAQWNAVRAMQEHVMLLRHAAEHLAPHDATAAARLREEAERQAQRVTVVLEFVEDSRDPSREPFVSEGEDSAALANTAKNDRGAD